MQDYLYGRYTTLERLRKVRDDPLKHPFHRWQADQSIGRILRQLESRPLMRLRERLIKATRAGDYHESWKIELLMRDYEYKHHMRAYEGVAEREDYEE